MKNASRMNGELKLSIDQNVSWKSQHALTHKNSCRLAESIADAERLRVGGRERLHLLGEFVVFAQEGRRGRKNCSQSPGTNHYTIARRCWLLLTSLREQGAPRRRFRALSIVSSATRRTRAISNTSYLRCIRALASCERKEIASLVRVFPRLSLKRWYLRNPRKALCSFNYSFFCASNYIYFLKNDFFA